MQELVTFILETDSGARMESTVTKAAHKICGQPLLTYVIDAAVEAGSDSLVLVCAECFQQLKEILPEGTVCISNNSGIDDGLAAINNITENKKGTILLLKSNMPLISGQTLKDAYEYHLTIGNEVTFLAAESNSESKQNQSIIKSSIEEAVPNACLINLDFLKSSSVIKSLSEMDFVKFINKLIAEGNRVGVYTSVKPEELMCVDDKIQQNEAENVILKRIIKRHMINGVTFHLPETSIIHNKVKIGRDTVIHPGTQLEGSTKIGENCEIGPNALIKDSIIGDDVHFVNSVISQSWVGNKTKVGPFAYIRPNSRIGQNIKIGDFVEIKNSLIGDDTKISHLSYIGDAELGKAVNIGCGVVVVNYDGRKKHKTIVGDHAFIGCNVNLVSPVEVKDYAYIAAGSTITDEVPEYSLAIARSRQTVIEDWVKKKGLNKK